MRKLIPRDQALAEFRHHQQAALMDAAFPDAERHAPFFQATAEILRAIDRIKQHQIAVLGGRLEVEALLPHEGHLGQVGLEMGLDQAFHIPVGLRDRTAIRLVSNVESTRLNGGHAGSHQLGHRFKQFSDAQCHVNPYGIRACWIGRLRKAA